MRSLAFAWLWTKVKAHFDLGFEPMGHDRSLDYNRVNGQYRIRYPDGAHSQRMCWDVASDYAKIFGGSIYNINQPGFLSNCACKSCVDNGARC